MRTAACSVAAAILLSLAACSTTTNPGAVDITRKQLLLVPSSQVNEMAAISFQEQNEKARAAGKLITQGPQFDRLQRIARRLEQQAPVFRPDAANWPWEMVLIDSPVLNASCAPGGKITLYSGLITKLNLTDDEIAMVVGHEIAHALREHGRERISQAVVQNTISQAALGAAQDRAGQIKLANQFAEVLYNLPNSRQNESEADRIGTELAARAGYNPQAAVSVWQKMDQASSGGAPPEWLSTHPANASRIAELTALQATVAPLYAAASKP